MARMVVIYRTPKDVEAFRPALLRNPPPLAKKIPGLRKYEISDGAIATPVGASDVHRIGTLYFDSLAAIEKAFASAEGKAAGADRRLFAPDDSGRSNVPFRQPRSLNLSRFVRLSGLTESSQEFFEAGRGNRIGLEP